MVCPGAQPAGSAGDDHPGVGQPPPTLGGDAHTHRAEQHVARRGVVGRAGGQAGHGGRDRRRQAGGRRGSLR